MKTEENVVLLRRGLIIMPLLSPCVHSAGFAGDSDLVALDVSVLCVHRWRVPRHVQLGGCRRLNGHILRRRCRHCWEAITHMIHTLKHIFMHFKWRVELLVSVKILTSELQPFSRSVDETISRLAQNYLNQFIV